MRCFGRKQEFDARWAARQWELYLSGQATYRLDATDEDYVCPRCYYQWLTARYDSLTRTSEGWMVRYRFLKLAERAAQQTFLLGECACERE